MDTATDLIYVGNGIYYDPTTGRFLNRNANPNSANPYVPWEGNPTGAVVAPLALLSLIYGRKKKRGTLDTIVILLVLGVSLAMSLNACTFTQNVSGGIVTGTATPAPNGTVIANGTFTPNNPNSADSPVTSPESSATCTATLVPTVTPMSISTLTPSEMLDKYTWAGLWTQSPGFINIRHRFDVYTLDYILHKDPRYTGIGLAKVTDAQMETTRGTPINGGHNGIGLGLRTVSCGFACPLGALDQDTSGTDYDSAYTAMQTRISLRTDVCLNHNCTATDEFIVAALAENESINPNEVQTALNQDKQTPPPVIIDWHKWLKTAAGKQYDISYDLMLIREFKGYVGTRSDLGVDWNYVDNLLQKP